MVCADKTLRDPVLNVGPSYVAVKKSNVLPDPGMIPWKPGFYVTYSPSSVTTTEIQV